MFVSANSIYWRCFNAYVKIMWFCKTCIWHLLVSFIFVFFYITCIWYPLFIYFGFRRRPNETHSGSSLWSWAPASRGWVWPSSKRIQSTATDVNNHTQWHLCYVYKGNQVRKPLWNLIVLIEIMKTCLFVKLNFFENDSNMIDIFIQQCIDR